MLNNRVFAMFAAATLAIAFGFANGALAARKNSRTNRHTLSAKPLWISKALMGRQRWRMSVTRAVQLA